MELLLGLEAILGLLRKCVLIVLELAIGLLISLVRAAPAINIGGALLLIRIQSLIVVLILLRGVTN